MKFQVYGIKTCDTVRKACKWFEAQGLEVERVDFRKNPPTRDQVEGWVACFGAKAMRNTSGGAYRALPEEKKEWDDSAWVEAFTKDPMLIKRPIVVRDGEAMGVGFRGSDEDLRARFID